MSVQAHRDDPLERWLAALAEDALSEVDRPALIARLRADPAARRRYVDYMLLHGMLRWEFLPGEAALATGTSLAIPASPNIPRPQRSGSRSTATRRRRWSAAVALAATLAMATIAAWTTGVLPGSRPLAVIIDSQDATWSDGLARVNGMRLDPGSLLLSSGLVQVRFRSGAEALIQGPAELVIESALSTTLRRGRMVARVPAAAHGFAVHVGVNTVVDLGTEFGVAADAGGGMLVRVFDGAVEVGKTHGAPPTRLTLGASVRLASDGGGPQPVTGAAAEGFVRMLPHALDDEGLRDGLVAWWQLDQTRGTVAADSSGHGHHGTLMNATFDQASVPGHSGRALECDGVGTYVAIPHHADFDLAILSIQAWVRPAPHQNSDAQVLSKYCAYGLAMPSNGAMKFYFWNMDHVFAFHFAADRWYHLCGVSDGRQRVLYVDGAPIGSALSSRPPFSKGELQIGALRGEISPNPAFFHGIIADVRLYDRALSADEVRRLYLLGERAAATALPSTPAP